MAVFISCSSVVPMMSDGFTPRASARTVTVRALGSRSPLTYLLTDAGVRHAASASSFWLIPRSLDDSREREFFKTAYTFLSQRYGVDNVVSAYVHRNSSRPHMHFAWVPVTKDGRLSAKSVVTRLELKTLHPDMQRFMESSLGCKVEILLDSEKAGERILSGLRLKDYTDAKAELERLDSEIAEKKAQLNEILRQEHEARERLAELICSAETLTSVKAS